MILQETEIFFLQTVTAMILVQLTLTMQRIWLCIMFYFFHMENIGGIGHYSCKMWNKISRQGFHNVHIIACAYISILKRQRLYSLQNAYFSSRLWMHGLFVIKINYYSYVIINRAFVLISIMVWLMH